MNLPTSDTVLTIAEVVSALGGAYYAVLKIVNNYKKHKESKSTDLLAQAKLYTDNFKTQLDNRISVLETEIHNLESDFKKDIAHVKEIQTAEIRNLSDRIELLRDDLRIQHSSILELLTKLVN